MRGAVAAISNSAHRSATVSSGPYRTTKLQTGAKIVAATECLVAGRPTSRITRLYGCPRRFVFFPPARWLGTVCRASFIPENGECDELDLRGTCTAVAELPPLLRGPEHFPDRHMD